MLIFRWVVLLLLLAGALSLAMYVGTGEARRINAWRAAERIHHEAAIVSKSPATQVPGLLRRL